MSARDTAHDIEAIRKAQAGQLLILGHYYQRGAVLRHADVVGDSLELARRAAASAGTPRIVLCGVRFMAESAAILTSATQTVFLSEPGAGCPMAEMADAGTVERAWRQLGGAASGWVPVVYVNSTASIKAFCGREGGSTCTSSNARRVLQWVFDRGRRVFFLPDEHLGTNTAEDLGIGESDRAVYDPQLSDGGLSESTRARARIICWKGFCLVHTRFTAAQVLDVRERWPGARIIVHPECALDVVRLADAHGSTSQIVAYVADAPAGSTVVVGTEQTLVERLAEQHRGRVTVKSLYPSVCANMARTTEAGLHRVLREWPPENEVHVDAETGRSARLALDRMLSL